ncbi:hypothetical protein LX32DRAFT_33576 [Colletotrichum zoysiae]|uniref:Uncharacterized protein n=1 Tax=Colletotrichum zoysiae TaxID=1216348 RepID=A0AAD9HE22_9PEZI|nr:hypothetical protein LX32DRAFT_33576 [Colletotrichum zoysiae]
MPSVESGEGFVRPARQDQPIADDLSLNKRLGGTANRSSGKTARLVEVAALTKRSRVSSWLPSVSLSLSLYRPPSLSLCQLCCVRDNGVLTICETSGARCRRWTSNVSGSDRMRLANHVGGLEKKKGFFSFPPPPLITNTRQGLTDGNICICAIFFFVMTRSGPGMRFSVCDAPQGKKSESRVLPVRSSGGER